MKSSKKEEYDLFALENPWLFTIFLFYVFLKLLHNVDWRHKDRRRARLGFIKQSVLCFQELAEWCCLAELTKCLVTHHSSDTLPDVLLSYRTHTVSSQRAGSDQVRHTLMCSDDKHTSKLSKYQPLFTHFQCHNRMSWTNITSQQKSANLSPLMPFTRSSAPALTGNTWKLIWRRKICFTKWLLNAALWNLISYCLLASSSSPELAAIRVWSWQAASTT